MIDYTVLDQPKGIVPAGQQLLPGTAISICYRNNENTTWDFFVPSGTGGEKQGTDDTNACHGSLNKSSR